MVTKCRNSYCGFASNIKQENINITFEQAEKLLQQQNKKATAIDTKMNIAIVDAGANLVAFGHMDGAWLGSLDTSAKKPKRLGILI